MKKTNIIILSAAGALLAASIGLYIGLGGFALMTRAAFGLTLAALLVLAVFNFSSIIAFFKKAGTAKTSWKIGQAAIVAAVIVFTYLLAESFPVRLDMTRARLYSLSEETRAVLKTLSNDVRAVFFKPASETLPPEIISILEYQEGLLKTYAEQTPRIKIETYDPDVAREKAMDYNISAEPTVVFEAGGNRVPVGFRKLIEQGQDQSGMIYRGEEVYTAAIKSLQASRPRKVFILTGHGEPDPRNTSPAGYSDIMRRLQEDGVEVRMLDLSRFPEVPQEAGCLVIANPVRDILPDQLDKIKSYFRDGGSILALVEYESTVLLNDILREAGLFYYKNYVMDRERFDPQRGENVLLPDILPPSEIVMPLVRNNIGVILPSAVSLQRLDDTERPQNATFFILPILKSSSASFGEVDPESVRRNSFKEDSKDFKGPLFLGYTVRRIKASVIETPRGSVTNSTESRMVVIGDSEFINNANVILGGNADLFQNSLNQLLRRDDAITLRPRTSQTHTYTLESAPQRFLEILSRALGFLLLIPGVIIVLRRRSKVKGQ